MAFICIDIIWQFCMLVLWSLYVGGIFFLLFSSNLPEEYCLSILFIKDLFCCSFSTPLCLIDVEQTD